MNSLRYTSPFFNIVFILIFLPLYLGLMADELGSYVPVFYMTGVILLVGSAVIFLLPFFKPENVRHATKSDERLLVVEKCTVV